MMPLFSELGRFGRYVLTPETEIAAVRHHGAVAGAVKAGVWMCLAVAAGIALARLLGQGV